jgi:hypothetical protein
MDAQEHTLTSDRKDNLMYPISVAQHRSIPPSQLWRVTDAELSSNRLVGQELKEEVLVDPGYAMSVGFRIQTEARGKIDTEHH